MAIDKIGAEGYGLLRKGRKSNLKQRIRETNRASRVEPEKI